GRSGGQHLSAAAPPLHGDAALLGAGGFRSRRGDKAEMAGIDPGLGRRGRLERLRLRAAVSLRTRYLLARASGALPRRTCFRLPQPRKRPRNGAGTAGRGGRTMKRYHPAALTTFAR